MADGILKLLYYTLHKTEPITYRYLLIYLLILFIDF